MDESTSMRQRLRVALRRPGRLLLGALVVTLVSAAIAALLGDANDTGRPGASAAAAIGGAVSLVLWLVAMGVLTVRVYRSVARERGRPLAALGALLVAATALGFGYLYAVFAFGAALLLSSSCCL